jgi:hypothetical protein
MAVNNTVKRYSRDLGIPIPMVRFGPSEFPRLNAGPAPYLPLQLENDRHEEFYVVLTGKVIALDSRGFVVPAGLKLQLEQLIAGVATGGLDWTAGVVANAERYDATDVAEAVLNSRGVQCVLNEPVIRSLHTSVAAANPFLDTEALPAAADSFDVGNHIGVAPYSFLRAGSDVMERALNENEFHPAAASGPDATVPYDPTQLRHLAWELQNRVTALVSAECLVYPVVASRVASGVLIEGQALAIGASMAAIPLGARMTFDENSDLELATSASAAFANIVPDFAVDADTAIQDAILAQNDRIVGQVVRKNVRFPSSLLDSVKTRWESSVPGFQDLDRMPGSATDGNPWRIHTAGTNFGEIQVSLLMK